MSSTAPAGHGFHDGERAVQHAAGVRAAAARLEGMLGPAELGAGVQRFLSERTFVAVTARDADGRLWVSPLVGPGGFVEVTGRTTVRLHAAPAADDPLHALPADQPVGLIALDLARRRRFRLNGDLTRATHDALDIEVAEAFGNCPQYITPRALAPAPGPTIPGATGARLSHHLDDDDRALIRRADTFVLGTSNPDHGNDASHRGGPPGFVRAAGDSLEWPDYPGNNMFTSLGNLVIDPTSALAFFDFDRGRTLHLSGRARLRRTEPGDQAGDPRRIAFDATAVAHSSLALRMSSAASVPPPSPRRSNP